MEGLEQIILTIGQMGFPSGVALILLYFMRKRETEFDRRYAAMSEATNTRLESLTQALAANTQMLMLLGQKLN